MATQLRPYQTKAEKEIFEAWKTSRSVMFQLCTGGGKTVIFVDIIKKIVLAGKRVILIAHREELITQAWNTLYKNEILAGIIKADHKTQFDLPVQVASIQTIARRTRLPQAHFVIVDEAHHSQDDNSYGNVLADHFPRAYILGVTATPYRLNRKGFTSMYGALVQGPKFKQLVDWGYLTPIRYFASSIPDLSNAKLSQGDYLIEDAFNAMKLAPIVESYFDHCRGMCGLVFAVNVEHSNAIVNQYLAAGLNAAHVDANTPPDLRKQIFRKLASRELHIVSNVGIATEGTDIPNIDFIQLARPTKSLSLFLQMIGRVTRTLHEAIQGATSDEDRAARVAASSKPYAYVLDNGGLWEEHGLPDKEFNWERYFIGIEKKKKTEIEDVIEILEYVAEDNDGRTVRTKQPKEIEGLRLIEINSTTVQRKKTVNITSLKEFDKNLAIFRKLPKMKKPGIMALESYKSYCRKNSLLMSSEIWDYLIKQLHTEPEDRIARRLAELERVIEFAHQSETPEEARRIEGAARAQADREVSDIKKAMVPLGLIKKHRAEYLGAEARRETVFE